MLSLTSLKDLANALDSTELDLLRLATQANELYSSYRVPKKGSGFRTLTAPSESLKSVQRRILKRLLAKQELSESCMGFRPGRSILSNAEPHCKRRFVFNSDIVDFFPSISEERVVAAFQKIGCLDKAAETLAKLTTYNGQLPQGAPSSPFLANLVATSLDEKLEAFAMAKGWTYTRYCDDFTISGDNHFGLRDMRLIRKLVESEGFKLSEKKTRLSRRNSAQLVTGIVVNERPNLPRSERRRLRAMFHNAYKDDERFACNRRLLEGYLAYLNMVNPSGKDTSKFRRMFRERVEELSAKKRIAASTARKRQLSALPEVLSFYPGPELGLMNFAPEQSRSMSFAPEGERVAAESRNHEMLSFAPPTSEEFEEFAHIFESSEYLNLMNWG